MNRRRYQYLMAFFILAVVMLLRLPAFWTPILDVDESQFAGYANALLDGGSPFISSVDTKPVGIYFFFSVIFLLFGRNNMIAVHLVTAIWVWFTALYCYRIGRLTYSERAGWLAALFYAVFTTVFIPKFISTSIIVVMMLPLTMSIYYIIRWEKDNDYHNLAISGGLLAISCLFKYQAGINILLVAAYFLIFSPLYLKDRTRRRKLKPFLILMSGGAIVGFFFFIYLKWMGVWDAFFFWSIRGSAGYIEAGSITSNFFERLLIRGGGFAASGLLIWFFGIREIGSLTRKLLKHNAEPKCPELYLVALWFLASIIPVLTGGRFFGHYFIQLLPALSILAAISFSRMINKAPWNHRRIRRIYAILIIGTVIPAACSFVARVYANEIYTALNEDNPNSYRPLGEYIKNRTKPHEAIFVWGFATPVYFFSDRPAASRFLWCDWLTGRISGSPTARDKNFDTSAYITPGSWEMFFEDIEKNRPTYFVDTSPGNYHDYGKYPISLYPKLAEYLNRYYRLEAKYRGADFYRRK